MVDSKQVAKAEPKALPSYDFKKGCPRCNVIPRNDFPFAQMHKPIAWPALIFHNGTMHPGTELTVSAPDPLDEQGLDAPVSKGMNLDGTLRLIPYRQALQEAIHTWITDPRARD